MDKYIRLKQLRLAVDAARGLISEWEKTCGPDIKVLVARWGDEDALLLVQNPPRPKYAVARKLRQMHFGRDTIDKLILRIALGTDDRVIVSDDSDFWDPTRPNDARCKGDENAPVARLCREELNVRILLLRMLMAELD